MTRGLWITGLVLMVSPLLVSTLMFAAADGWEGVASAFVFTFVLGPILFIVGLILLIIGLASGGDGGQQQQQQVVVYSQGGAHCTQCGNSLDAGQRFCSSCGAQSG